MKEEEEQRPPFAGQTVRLWPGALASCPVAGTGRDYTGYCAFRFVDEAHRKIQLSSGQLFEARLDTATRTYIFLELRQGGPHYQLEALGCARDTDGALLLDDESVLMLPRLITSILDADALNEAAARRTLDVWCRGSRRDELPLYFEWRQLATDRATLYRFQCRVVVALARRYHVAMTELVATLDATIVAHEAAKRKRKRVESQDHPLLRRAPQPLAPRDEPDVVTAVPLYVFEGRAFGSLAELTAHCAQLIAEARGDLALERTRLAETCGDLALERARHQAACQLHASEKASWVQSQRLHLDAAYMRGRLEQQQQAHGKKVQLVRVQPSTAERLLLDALQNQQLAQEQQAHTRFHERQHLMISGQ